MFETGNFVVNATNGICEITDIVSMEVAGTKKEYYLLIPVEEKNAKVYIVVNGAENKIRLVMTKDEAMELVKEIPNIEEAWVENEKERERLYKEAIASRDPKRLVAIIKTLYNRCKERTDAGKKSTAVDERYFKLAQNQLHAELAFALGEEKKDIKQIIQTHQK